MLTGIASSTSGAHELHLTFDLVLHCVMLVPHLDLLFKHTVELEQLRHCTIVVLTARPLDKACHTSREFPVAPKAVPWYFLGHQLDKRQITCIN